MVPTWRPEAQFHNCEAVTGKARLQDGWKVGTSDYMNITTELTAARQIQIYTTLTCNNLYFKNSNEARLSNAHKNATRKQNSLASAEHTNLTTLQASPSSTSVQSSPAPEWCRKRCRDLHTPRRVITYKTPWVRSNNCLKKITQHGSRHFGGGLHK